MRIIDATIETLQAEGMVGTTARAIARAGGFNQALIYYHFDSLDGLFFAVVEHFNQRRLDRFGPKLEQVSTFGELIDIAIALQSGEPAPAENGAVALVVAGWSGSSDHGPRVLEALRPWDNAVGDALRRITSSSGIAQTVPIGAVAHGVSALFLGLELLDRLDPDDGATNEVYEALAQLGTLATRMLSPFPSSKPADDAG